MALTSLLADKTLGLFLTTTTVSAVDRLTANFTEVELSAEGWDGSSWAPGQKLQMRPQSGTFGLRTYTPMDWDTAGSTRILAYSHGSGPGALYFGSVEVGQTCEVFGPRKSLDLTDLSRPTVFVGDETSIGLAVALRRGQPELNVAYVFEANDIAEVDTVLAHYGLTDASAVVAKSADRAPLLNAIEAGITAVSKTTADAAFDIALSGDAATVAAVRRWFRDSGHSPATTKVKAYWAEGRTGMD